MENKKQTAVEWLIEQLKDYDFADAKDTENYIIKIPAWILTEKQEQALQMEKEQCKEDYDAGLFDGSMDDVNDRFYKNSEQYYKQTYGK